MKIDQKYYRTIQLATQVSTKPIAGADPAQNGTHFSVEIIDQTFLPHRFEMRNIQSLDEMITAIKTMQVRGAPLIGAAAAYGMALATQQNPSDDFLRHAATRLIQSRPTAVNLSWAATRMLKRLSPLPTEARHQTAWQEAALICDEDVAINQAIGQHGFHLIQAMAAKKNAWAYQYPHPLQCWLVGHRGLGHGFSPHLYRT